MNARPITCEEAKETWKILVELAGAYDAGSGHEEYSFVYSLCSDEYPCTEYRFMGALGYGGKFRNNGNNNDIPYVDCYQEDLTPERQAIIDRTNAALKELFAKEAS